MLKKIISFTSDSIYTKKLHPKNQNQLTIEQLFYVNRNKDKVLIAIETQAKTINKFIIFRIGKFEQGILTNGFIFYNPCLENRFVTVEQGIWDRNGKEKSVQTYKNHDVKLSEPSVLNHFIKARIGTFKKGVLIDGFILYKPCAENGFLFIQQGTWTKDGVAKLIETFITATVLPQGVFPNKEIMGSKRII